MPLRHLTPMLSVADMARSLAFYRDTLGLELLNTLEHEGRIGWAVLGAGGRPDGDDGPCRVELMLSAEDQPCAGGDPLPGRRALVLYFNPDDVTAYHAELRARGVAVGELTRTYYGMLEFRLEDPDGYPLWFGQDIG